jgi:hypothetical protein
MADARARERVCQRWQEGKEIEMRRRRRLALVVSTIVVALLLLGGLAACAPCSFLPIPGGAPEIEFWADEEVLPPGGCTVLHWQVSTGEQYPVFLNGREVAPEGEQEVCLEGPTTYELVVGVPGGSVSQTVMIRVEGEPEGPPPEEPGPGEPPEEPGPEGGPEVINLIVDPDVVPAGGCAVLHWEVMPPEFAVFLNGQEVPPVGEREECPEGTVTYELIVEAPGGPQQRTVTLQVEGGGPPPEPTPQPPAPPAATATSPPPAQPTSTQPPPAQPTATQPPPGPSPTATPWTTDLAMTDLYADKLQNGTVYGRITNRGPGTIVNVVVNFSCEWGKTAYGATLGLHEQMGPRNMTIVSLAPGQTTPFNTYITVDLTQYWYNMTCTVNVPFSDPDTSNNTYNETLAKP